MRGAILEELVQAHRRLRRLGRQLASVVARQRDDFQEHIVSGRIGVCVRSVVVNIGRAGGVQTVRKDVKRSGILPTPALPTCMQPFGPRTTFLSKRFASTMLTKARRTRSPTRPQGQSGHGIKQFV